MPMLLVAAAVLCAACVVQPPVADEPVATPRVSERFGGDMAEFIRRYDTDRRGVSRFYNLPWSEARFDRMERVYDEWQERLAGVDFDALDQQGKIDAILLRNELRAQRAGLDLDRARLAEMDPLMPFRREIQNLALAQWRMEPLDSREAAGRLAALPEQIKQLRDRIKKAGKESRKQPRDGGADGASASSEESQENSQAPLEVSPVLAKRAAAAVGEVRRTLREWYEFYAGYEPDFAWWVRQPYEEASSALDGYAKFLREEIAGQKGKDDDPLVGDPIGREALLRDLRTEVIPYTPEELIAIGERELAWCEAEMKKAAAEMGLGDDWKAALRRVKDRHVPPGEQDELVAAQARHAIRWLKERDLVTIPPLCEETWRLTMISPQTQRVLPFAAYGGQNMMVAYPTDTMKHEDKLMSMRGNNRHFSRIVTPHELIPGHHLQAFMAQRERPYRGIFSTPFLVEGWALYWEMTMWELGYPETPEDRIGMLFWRMHRAARIIVSLAFHLGEMEPKAMVDFLVDRVGHERFGATSEVRRFIGGDYAPLYQCGYMIGGLQFRAMRRELVDSGRMTERAFHDAILTYGPIPVELIRAGMMGLPLARAYEAEWRFDGP